MWRNIRRVEQSCNTSVIKAWFRSPQGKRIGFHTNVQAQDTLEQVEISASQAYENEYELGQHVLYKSIHVRLYTYRI